METKLSLKLVKLFRLYLKILPIILATTSFSNCVISYFGVQLKIYAHIFFFLIISFIYISSYVLKFCEYHRVSLHYIVIIYIINCYDYYIGIPVNYIELFMIYSITTFIAIFIGICFKIKHI